jgi:predicted Fe-Mo cluster-binding NifX family protein
MPWRVAVSSLDGILINEHFGRARWFYIIDAEKGGAVVTVEQRMVTPLSMRKSFRSRNDFQCCGS